MLWPNKSLLDFDGTWPAGLCWERDALLVIRSTALFLAI